MRRFGWLHMTYTTDDLAEREQLVTEITEAHAAAALAMTQDLSRAARLSTAFLEGAWDDIADTSPGLSSSLPLSVHVENAQVARARGEHERAWEHIHAVFPQGPPELPGNEYRLTLWLIRVAVALALDADDPVTAQTWLAAHDRWQTWSGCVLWRAEEELLWARYDVLRGHRAQARERAERALAIASEPRQPLALLAAHRTLGEFDTGAGDHTAAYAHLDTALALADACRAPFERALTLLAHAELHIATGRTEEARGVLDEVRTICTPLGTRPALAHADALAARLATIQTRPDLPAGLTEREAEVLSMVAQGLTNTQVAERLFISRRTVEFHLSSVYNKVGVSSRAAATRFALEHDLS
jgi:DNA-binding CsgD family transcriptional regulator